MVVLKLYQIISIFYDVNVLNENTFSFLKSVINMINHFSSHFLVYPFTSKTPQGSSLLCCLESLIYISPVILCIALSHVLLPGNHAGWLYSSLIQRFLFLWWRVWTRLPRWQMMLWLRYWVTSGCPVIGCEQKTSLFW